MAMFGLDMGSTTALLLSQDKQHYCKNICRAIVLIYTAFDATTSIKTK